MLSVTEIKERIRKQFLKEEFAGESEQVTKEDVQVIADDEDIKIIQYTVFVANESEIIIHQYFYRKFEQNSSDELEHNRVLLRKEDFKSISID